MKRIVPFLSLFFVYAFCSKAQSLTNDPINGMQDIQIGTSSGCQRRLAVDIDPNTGNKVFVWQEDPSGSGNRDINCAIYDANMNCIQPAFTVNKTTAGDQIYPTVRVNKNDNSFIVVWSSFINNGNTADPNQYDIYAKKMSFNNVQNDKLTNDLLINTNGISGNQIMPSIAFDYGYLEVIIAWIDQNGRDIAATTSTVDYGSFARRVNYNGSALSLITNVNDFPINSSVTTGHQTILGLEMSPVTGELYSICQYQNWPGGNDYDIVFRRFYRDMGGNLVAGSEVLVNTSVTNTQSSPSITVNSLTGDYLISWQTTYNNSANVRGWDSYSKVYNKQGTIVKDEFKVAPFTIDDNEIGPKAVIDEYTGNILYFHWYGVTGSASIRYTIFDKNYVKIANETTAVGRNLNNPFGNIYKVLYDQISRKVFLSYDQFNSSNTNISYGFFSQFKFLSHATSNTSAQNYLEIIEPFKILKEEALLNNLPVSAATVNRNYFDGLGRPIQNVSIEASPFKKDLVQPLEYDSYGRQVKFYLPYVHSSEDGAYKNDYNTAQPSFYNNLANNNADKIVNDLYPYAEKVYETGVANVDEEDSKEGNIFRLGAGHTSVIFSNVFNSTTDKILFWQISNNNAISTSAYSAGTLTKIQIKDESGKYTEVFKDVNGNIVCKNEYPLGSFPANPSVTYYIYDVFNNLRFIIPPKAVQILNNSGSTTLTVTYNGTSNTDNMVFSYNYDKRQRLIEKRVPNQKIQYFVYNQSDQLVLTQDGNQRLNGTWSFIKYDQLGRVIMTGITQETRAISLIQADMASKLLYETRNISTSTGYTNNAYPVTADLDVMSISFYDDYNYDFDNIPSTTQNYIRSGLSPEPVPAVNNFGRLTGSRIRNLETNDWLIKVFYYDNKGRQIQELSNNHRNLTVNSYITYVYDFDDKILGSKSYTKTSLNNIVINIRNEYDNARRLINTYQRNNSDPEVLIRQFTYNELGQKIQKNLHSEAGGAFLQSVDYTYNINGALTHINNSSLSNNSTGSTPPDNNDDGNDLFGMQVAYENILPDISNTPDFSGNISAFKWRTSNSATSLTEKAYKYNYDGMYRLMDATFGENTSGTFQFGNKYRETGITYDLNDNIVSLKRYDEIGGLIDDLTYDYTSMGNQVRNVNDASNNATGFNNRATQSQEYYYDDNGNLKTDNNKQIAAVTYNYLNLPQKIEFGTTPSNNRIEYVYDAAGNLLIKRVMQAGVVTRKSDYIKGIYYENDRLKFFPTSEGRAISASPGSSTIYKYQYFLKDYLGNVRVTFDKDSITGNARILQEDNYYSFGMKMKGMSYLMANNGGLNLNQYTGKEYQEGMDINNDRINDFDFDLYNFGARMYDPVLGRWHSVDPMAANLPSYSPYVFSLNNPVSVIDPDGAFPYQIYIRSFAPFDEFGGYFHGDGADRGFTTSLTATSRVAQTFEVDPSAGYYSGLRTWSDPSYHPVLGTATEESTGNIFNFNSSEEEGGASVISWTSSMRGANPLVPLSPDIDVTTSFSLVENTTEGKLDITATQVGDRFPAAETFIQDSQGNSLFIGVSSFKGNPYISLPGDNQRPMMSSSFSVAISEEGEFLGVTQGDQTYSIEGWNNMMRGQPLNADQEYEGEFGGGGSGSGGAGGNW